MHFFFNTINIRFICINSFFWGLKKNLICVLSEYKEMLEINYEIMENIKPIKIMES
jgi:hypothetical protein